MVFGLEYGWCDVTNNQQRGEGWSPKRDLLTEKYRMG